MPLQQISQGILETVNTVHIHGKYRREMWFVFHRGRLREFAGGQTVRQDEVSIVPLHRQLWKVSHGRISLLI